MAGKMQNIIADDETTGSDAAPLPSVSAAASNHGKGELNNG